MKRFAIFVSCVLLSATTLARAQSVQSAPDAAPKATAHSAADVSPKRCFALDYVLKEFDGTKVINQRAFVLNTFAAPANMPSSQWTRLRVGNRVPLPGGSGKDISYIDIGVNIDNTLREAGDALALEVTAEISSVAPDAGGNGLGAAPTVRQVKGTAMSTIYPGKPAVVFSADDPGSQHRFELQVTATPVR